jgi:putative ABC transport system ATP-binding protein
MIKLENIQKSYRMGDFKVQGVNNITLEIRSGELAALAGPSGSGKTTLLNLIGGLLKPDAGQISVNGKPLYELTADALCRFRLQNIGFVFQDYNLIPTLTAFENIELLPMVLGTPAGERKKRVRDLLERVKMGSLAGRLPSQMSRGQQQRVAICRALINKPQLVLGDEMTANLDSVTGAELMDFVHELNRSEGTTFVYSTHDPAMMKQASRVIHLRDGLVTS